MGSDETSRSECSVCKGQGATPVWHFRSDHEAHPVGTQPCWACGGTGSRDEELKYRRQIEQAPREGGDDGE